MHVLAHLLGLSQSALSQHLSKLRALGLVSARRDAQTVYYSSHSPAVIRVLQVLESIYTTEETSQSALAS